VCLCVSVCVYVCLCVCVCVHTLCFNYEQKGNKAVAIQTGVVT
jgi:hypothetical protein